ncbi:6-phospho-beta-glucosidase [Mycolicibacterium goodii]|uniref:6-phospho-beta-glucosidase n=1 Tax=Mycolicibacterium goodii TaxID=134601 RepID=UPI001BDCD929|nr:6-phospho-beta-glucosidase [Mycolicibacterium goodii]MBU8808230.1 6-phospho-beta-glucosidase [Mycolicibacterium goodii]
MKLAILGGGGFRTPYVWQALIRDQGSPRVTEVALYDVDDSRLATIVTICEQLAVGFDDAPTLHTYTDLEPALEGADFVFAAIRVGGVEQRCCDEHVALDHNVLGQETTGPGGIAYALRTVPVMLDIAETVKRVAPQAYFLNFTNPAGIITEALQSVLGDRALGICDTPSGLGRRVAGVLGYDHTRIQMDYVGLNHLGWMRRVLVDGVDVLPNLLADEHRLSRMEETQVFGADWIHSLGVIPNEYLYYYYFNRDAVRRILESPRTRGDFLLETQNKFFTTAAENPDTAAKLWAEAVDERGASYMAEAKGGVQGEPAVERERETDPAHLGYAGVALGVMAAISRDERRTMILNVRNRGTIAGLPADAVVEVPTTVDANGVHPLTLDTQPDLHQLGLMQQVKAVERHAISAAINGSADEALKAFALHPLVDSVTVARQLLAGYIAANPDLARVLANSSLAA